jgi:hypothetical protein
MDLSSIRKKEVLVQRLFSAFPNSWPGRGILLLRFVTATFLLLPVCGHPVEPSEADLVVPHWIGAGAGALVLVGLWTPVCGAIVALVEAWIAFCVFGSCGVPIMLATSGATLAMTGPGAWSFDARLFGRKHFEVTHR